MSGTKESQSLFEDRESTAQLEKSSILVGWGQGEAMLGGKSRNKG